VIRIIGIGAPFGDDAVGLEVARLLTTQPLPHCEVVAADRPGAGLIDLLDGMEAVILVDAVRSGARPGTLHQLTFAELAQGNRRFVSSHEMGVIACVELARKLRRCATYGGVLGIEIASIPPQALHILLSPVARRAARRAKVRIQGWVRELSPTASGARFG
jgi:hydrogenase maturation protease